MRQAALEAQLEPDSRSPSPEPLTHAEEQRRLRNETIAAFHQDGNDNGDGDDLFVPREKTKDEQEREEEEYRSFLEREVGGDLKALVAVEESIWKDEPTSQTVNDKKKKKKKSKDSGKGDEDDQEFLMKYVSRSLDLRSYIKLPHSATFLTGDGLTAQHIACRHIKKSSPQKVKGRARL